MRSTGEVLGMADSFGMAFFKAQEATQSVLPLVGSVLITVAERDKPGVIEAARQFSELGFRILATEGTSHFLRQQGIEATEILKLKQGRPNIIDAIKNGEIQLIINTPRGKSSHEDDSYIRQAAINYKIPFITTPAAALAAAKGIAARKKGEALVKSLQSYHKELG